MPSALSASQRFLDTAVFSRSRFLAMVCPLLCHRAKIAGPNGAGGGLRRARAVPLARRVGRRAGYLRHLPRSTSGQLLHLRDIMCTVPLLIITG